MYARLDASVNAAEFQQLQRDHATMRAKLQQLKSMLNGGAPYIAQDGVGSLQSVRALCVALARRLKAHIRHEGRLANRCSMALGRLGPDELARLALEHHVDQESLYIINQSLAHESNGWVPDVGSLLLGLIASLKRQMDAQEADLFPFLERVLAIDHHANGATRVEGTNGMEHEEAWERSVGGGENENGTDRDGGAAGGAARLIHTSAGG